MKTMIAVLALLLVAMGPTFAASSIHSGPWPIYNGVKHQPRQWDLPPAVQLDEGHVTPSERDFDKTLQICQPC
jgi:hypothetical protein